MGDSAFVTLSVYCIGLRVEAEAVLVKDGEKLARRGIRCGKSLEGSSIQWDAELSTALCRSVPYGHEWVVVDQWRLSRWQGEHSSNGCDGTYDEPRQERWSNHDASGQKNSIV